MASVAAWLPFARAAAIGCKFNNVLKMGLCDQINAVNFQKSYETLNESFTQRAKIVQKKSSTNKFGPPCNTRLLKMLDQ